LACPRPKRFAGDCGPVAEITFHERRRRGINNIQARELKRIL
jgi:hypothetical protein